MKGRGDYPPDWGTIAHATKTAANWCCIRCGHKHDRLSGHVLTTHHWDGDKANCRWWNCLALCQRCHLQVQAKVSAERPWVLEHSEWFKPYVAGFYAVRYLGQQISREEVMDRLEELLKLEAMAVIGQGPLAVATSHDAPFLASTSLTTPNADKMPCDASQRVWTAIPPTTRTPGGTNR